MSTKECKRPALVVPVINRNRCEGKQDCVEVCPYGVFAMGKLGEAERGELTTLGRVRAFFHGYKQAFVVHAELCQACGLCVTACPEKAIKLQPVGAGAA